MSEPAKPSGGDELVEMEAMDLEEWERDKHTPQAGEKLDALVKQTAAAPPAPPASRSTQSIARTVTRTPAAGVGVAKTGEGNPFDGPTVRNAGAALAAAQKTPQTPPGGSPIARITPTKVATPPQGTPVARNTMVRTPALGVGVGAPATRTEAAPAAPARTQTPAAGVGAPARTQTPAAGVGAPARTQTPAAGVGAPARTQTPAAGVGAPARTQTPAAGVGVPSARPTAAQPPQTPPPRPTAVQPPQVPPARVASPPPTPTSTRTQALPIVTRAPASAPVGSVRVPDKAKPRVEETEGWSLPDDEPAKPAAPAAAKPAAPSAPAAKPVAAKIAPARAQSPDPSRIVAPKPKLEALQAENWTLDDSAIEDPYAPKDSAPDANLGSVPIAALAGQVTPTPSAGAAKPAAAKPAPAAPTAAKPTAPPARPAMHPATAAKPAPAAKPEDAVDFDSPFAASTTVGTLDDDLPIAIAPAASGARPFVESVSPASSPAIDPLNPPTLDPDALKTLDPDSLRTMDPDAGDLAVAGDDLAVPSAIGDTSDDSDDSDDRDDSDDSDGGDVDDLSEFPPAPVVVAPAHASGRRNTPAPVHTLAPPMGALPTDPSLPPAAPPQRNTPPPMQAVSPVDAFAQTHVPPSRMQTPIPPSTSQPIPTFRPPSQPELFEAEDARSAHDQRSIKTDMFAAQKLPGSSKKLFLMLGGAAVVVVIILFFVLGGDKKPTVATTDKPVATKGSDVVAPTPPPETKGSNDTAGSSATPETHEPVATNTPPETHEPVTTPPETHEPVTTPPVTHEPTTNPPTGRTPTGRTPTGRAPKNPKGNKVTTTPTTPVETANPSDGGAAKAAYADGNKALYAADAQGAITHFKAALAAQPGFAAAHRGLGLAYSLSGSKAQAISEFKAYLAASPGAKDATKIQERITALQK